MAVPATRRWTLAFWVVFAAAAALRMIRLSSWDLWTDEANTFWTAVTGEYVSGPMYASAPVNFLLTKLAIAWLGPNELGARIVPFLAGTATIGLAYFAMRRWIGPRAAFFASLVLTLSIWHLYWSQTARHFSLETLFLLGAVHAFVRFWREGSKSGLALAALLVLAALFTHENPMRVRRDSRPGFEQGWAARPHRPAQIDECLIEPITLICDVTREGHECR